MFLLGSGPVFVVFLLVLLFALVLRWRNASLAGGFAGRRVGGFLRLCLIYRFAYPIGHDCPLYKYFLLCSCKDRAFSATSATLEEKKKSACSGCPFVACVSWSSPLASALCGAPLSTPCCVCCFGASPSCTEVVHYQAFVASDKQTALHDNCNSSFCCD